LEVDAEGIATPATRFDCTLITVLLYSFTKAL